MSENLISADLQVKGRASFLILLQTVHDLVSRQADAPPSFNGIGDDVLRYAKDAPSGGEELLTAHRRTLIGALRDIFTLNLYVDIVRDWLIHGGLLYEAALAEDTVPDDGRALFFAHLQAMLDLSRQQNDIAAQVLQISVSHVPLRMATLKYKSYVADSVRRSGLPLGADTADSFKRFFNPMAFLNGIEWLEALRGPLDGIWEKDCVLMNKDSLPEDFKTVNGVRDEISRLVDYLCVLFDGVNAAYIVSRHCPGDFDKEQARALSETRLDEAVEAQLQKIVYEAGGEVPADTGSPDADECQKITEMFYETGLDYFNANGGGRAVSGNDTDGFLAAFLPYVEAPDLAANRKRFLRQHLMAYLPYPYGMEEYQQYFLDTYAALDDANRRYLCVYVANQVKESQEKSGK